MAVLSTEPAIPVLAFRLGSWRVEIGRQALTGRALSTRYDAAAAGWAAALARHDMPRAYAALLSDALHGWDGPVRALDCGMGTGALSLALCRAAPGRVAVEGVDVSEAMLAQARAALSRQGVPVRTRVADLRALPQADAGSDLTMVAHAIEHLPDPRAALREMARVTRPGGRVVVCATRASLPGFLIQMRWRTHRIEPATLAGWMRGAGLVEVRRLAARSRRFDALSSAWVGTVPDGGSSGGDGLRPAV